MTDREYTARLAGEEKGEDDSFLNIEQAVEAGMNDLFFEWSRTLDRILRKAFRRDASYDIAHRALREFLEVVEADDVVIHFSTGTSYRFQVKQSACALNMTLTPLPPSDLAKLKLQRAQHALLNPPKRLSYPIRREREKVSHLAVAMNLRGRFSGVLKIADASGANEVYRCVHSDPDKLIGVRGVEKLQSFAIFTDPDPERGSSGASALIEPYGNGSLAHSSTVMSALDVDLLMHWKGAGD